MRRKRVFAVILVFLMGASPTSEEVGDIDRALDNMEMSEVFGGSKIVSK